MSVLLAPAQRTIAFGDPDAGVWGVLWGGVLLSAGGAAPATLAIEDDRWKLSGEEIALTASPAGSGQICEVRGNLAGREVECLGCRGSGPDGELDAVDSVRHICAWFGPSEGLALTTIRPRRARGHDEDEVTVALFGPEGQIAVEEPRVSTTYSAGGDPLRLSLELWLEPEPEDEEAEPYPRRAAAEAAGPGAAWTGEGIDVRAHPLRWHSAGLDGGGVYLHARAV